jgi:hypothetical protein
MLNGVVFDSACVNHDACYTMSGVSRFDCDLELHADIYMRFADADEVVSGAVYSSIYFLSLRVAGGPAYIRAPLPPRYPSQGSFNPSVNPWLLINPRR